MRRRLFLISNMYPSKEHPSYGILVKRFRELVEKEFTIELIVIKKQVKIWNKLISYAGLYFRIIVLYFKASTNDIIYVHFPLYMAPMLLPMHLLNKNVVLNFHGSDVRFNTPLKRVLRLFLGPLVKKSKIVVPSKAFSKIVEDEFKVEENQIIVYPSGGIDKKVFYPLKTKKEVFTLGFISNLIKPKGWETFLSAIHIIKESNSVGKFQAIMVGHGVDKNKILKYIEEKDLPIVLKDAVEQEKLAEIYNALDIFVFPSLQESLGLVGLEALMCGTPVIASQIDGPSEYLIDGLNGFLFEKGNAKDLAKKVIEFVALPPSDKIQMKENCVRSAQKYESTEVTLGLLEAIKTIK